MSELVFCVLPTLKNEFYEINILSHKNWSWEYNLVSNYFVKTLTFVFLWKDENKLFFFCLVLVQILHYNFDTAITELDDLIYGFNV